MISIETRSGKRAYETVAERVKKFREKYPVDSGWRIVTEMNFPKEDLVLCRATILDPEGRVVATGTAEEQRGSNFINRTSAVENAETSAIGRALFSAGFGGGEFCSADELAVALKRQEELMAAESAGSSKEQETQGQAERSDQSPSSRPAARSLRGRIPPAESDADAKVISPEAFGLPNDCGITFIQSGNLVYAKDQEKGATFNNRESLKNAGFSFDGRQRVWFREVVEEETV
jgi:hypothetical protein